MFEILGDTYNATAVAAILLFKDDLNFQVVLYGAQPKDYIMYDADEDGEEFEDEDACEAEYLEAVARWRLAAGVKEHEVAK